MRFSHLAAVLPVLLACLGASARGADGQFKVGLILAGSATDGGWNQLAAETKGALERELHAKVSVLQKVTPDKAGDEMRGFAGDGYNLVIGHGYEFLNPAAEIAAGGGATRFAVSGADAAKDGLATLDFDLSGASYQIGVLAARLSASHKLGFIGGSPIPSVKACYRGFLAGARSVTPGISVAETYTSWDQPEQSKAQAEALLAQGVDGIYHDVDAASRGIFEAIKEHDGGLKAGAAPAYVYGSVADQNGNAVCPSDTPASAVIKLDVAFLALARSVQAGTFAAGVHHEDLKSGTCVLALNPALVSAHTISAEVVAEVDEAGKRLAAGSLTIPAAP